MKFTTIMIMALVLALFTFNASAGCGRWVVRDNTDYLKDPTFDELTSGQDENASGNSPQSSSQSNEKENNALIDKDSASNTKMLDISGKWLVKFEDNSTPLNLILIQSGSRVQGYGSIKENGTEVPVTTVGSVFGNAISLDVKQVLDVSINKNGNYSATQSKPYSFIHEIILFDLRTAYIKI